MEANDRLPKSDTRSLRRAILLHEEQRHTDCVKWFQERFAELDRRHELFGPAATVAALSAHKLSKPDLVRAWSAELDSHPHLGEHAALLRFYVEIENNPIGAADALNSLTERYEALGRPFAMAIALLQELNPTDARHAPLCVELGNRVRKSVEASPALAAHVGLALVTTEDWNGLLAWCEAFKARVDAGPRMLAFEALALDRLGRTHQARELLESMLAGGVLDSLALNTYTMIMVRCGYVQEALDAAEKILQSATTKRQQTDCLRLLFNLVQESDPTSSRLLALAAQMGRLANQESEVEEGIFLTMFLTATLDERNAPKPVDRNDFQRRVEAFFVRFPNSNILKRAQLREDASGPELMAQLKAMIGHSDEREAFQRRVESQLQQGLTAVPFCLRPKVALAHVRDAAHLWEIAKTSRVDDRKYHLTMIADTNWSPPSASKLRERTPMLDLTSLMVLLDLGLIDAAIDFFGQVAIAKSTLESLAALARPFSGSPAAARAVALQDALKPRLGSIVQPSISGLPDSDDEDVDEEKEGRGGGDNRALGRELREITRLCQDQRYRIYSDDLCVRVLVAQGAEPDGICTLDVLAALEEAGALAAREAAQKVAALCRWHVGIVVRLAVFVALLPPALATVSSAKRGIELLDGDVDFMAVANGVWDFRAPFEKVLSHAAAILRKLAEESPLPNQALASIFGQWFFKAALKDDAPGAPLGALAQLIARAALPPGMREAVAARLWTTYRQLVELREGDFMDERKELVAIALLGAECARLRKTVGDAGEAARASMQSGLTEGTAEASAFMAGYSDELMRLSAQAKRGSR